jgi:hypothetical protein
MVASKAKIRCLALVALVAVSAVAGGSSVGHAQEQAPDDDLWRCVARTDFYKDNPAFGSPETKAISGTIRFHRVTPGEWPAQASVRFTSLAEDPETALANGIRASVYQDEPGRIYVLAVVDGEQQRIGWYPAGTPVPFKVTFDDSRGTVSIESGKFSLTAKPTSMLRSTTDMTCSGADVSFASFNSEY